MIKKYVVIADGYEFEGYGTQLYLLGVFGTRSLAERCVSENTIPGPGASNLKIEPFIIEVNENEPYPLKKVPDSVSFCEYVNDRYIGGYLE